MNTVRRRIEMKQLDVEAGKNYLEMKQLDVEAGKSYFVSNPASDWQPVDIKVKE